MKTILTHLFGHNTLSRDDARRILIEIGEGRYTPVQISAFLIVFQMRTITVEELSGFRDALLELCIPIDLRAFRPLDLCGTGGDGKDTFNISTLASFVTAGAGIFVAKHGNYGVSSVCGSSNIMEAFGYKFTNDQEKLRQQIETAGICFLHAPFFHPAMKHVAPVRKELATKTFFNMLGPMVNPARPEHQLVGVYSLELARLYHYLYQRDQTRYVILHSLDGCDEVSLTCPFKMITNTHEELVTPAHMGLSQYTEQELRGGRTIEESAAIFSRILHGEGTAAQNAVVSANAALAIRCVRPQLSLNETLGLADESLKSGAALRAFQKLLAA
ncbi:MAG TPA: anthranilate phosphoribosyltransferase [Saprospiraceae bacterium]|nr:anthranilate phosphoribosyltransferase [Saprospiraceae bacterium]